MNDLVSILIAVRDGARYLGEAIGSALDQPGAQVEVVVVDDGSTDDSAALAQSFGDRVRVLRQEPLGIGPARNTAVAASEGAFLAFLDADDRLTPHKSASQLDLLLGDPDLEAVFGSMRQFISPDAPEQAESVHIASEVAPIATPTTMLIRRHTFDRVGPFASIPIAVSIDWMFRTREADLRSVMLDAIVCERRIHENNVGIQRRAFAPERLRVLKASLDRRRAMGQP